MPTPPDYVEMLRDQNRLIGRIMGTNQGTRGAFQDHWKLTSQLLKALLGRAPTTEEIRRVCNW